MSYGPHTPRNWRERPATVSCKYTDDEGRPYDPYNDTAIVGLWRELFPVSPEDPKVNKQLEECWGLPKQTPGALATHVGDIGGNIIPGATFNFPTGLYIVVEGGPLDGHPGTFDGHFYETVDLGLTRYGMKPGVCSNRLANLFVNFDLFNHLQGYSIACVHWQERGAPYDHAFVAGPFVYDGATSECEMEDVIKMLEDFGLDGWYHTCFHRQPPCLGNTGPRL